MAYEVFISYAHKDKKLRERLEISLSSLKHQNLITSWHDGDIVPGTEWNQQIFNHLNSAHIILLLISPDFIASPFCYGAEMEQAIARHDNHQACVIPIILRPTYWKNTPFAKLQALPDEGKPVSGGGWKPADAAFKNIVQGIQDAIMDLEKNSTSAIDSNVELCKHYCKKLHEQWKMLDFKGIQHTDLNRPVTIPLTEVFVLPNVFSGIPEYETLERVENQKSDINKDGHQKEHEKDEQENLIQRETKVSKEKKIIRQRADLHIVLAKQKRLIILGDPGSGKSTLLRYLMLVLSEDSEKFTTEFPQFAAIELPRVPLYIPLASYAESWLSHGMEERSFTDFLPLHLRYNYLDGYTNTIQHQLTQGNLFILFDGLDEIPDVSLRMQIVRQIEAFTLSYPQNHFIVTSRIIGYKEAPLAAEYQAYTLEDFNDEQIKVFAYKWCPAYERWVKQVKDNTALEHAATIEAEKLYQATHLNEGVKRLAVNPLLLTILALIQRQGIDLPSHRVELFDLCTSTLLESWVKARGHSEEKKRFSKNDLIKILRPLSFWMHEHPAIGAIPEEELLDQIAKQLLERKITRHEDEAYHLAQQFLQTVRGQTGILVERGKQRYGFLHLTFEEYFAAWDLALQKKGRDAFIQKHLHDSRWRVVILLTVSIIGILQSDEEGVTDLVGGVIHDAKSPFESLLHRDLQVAGLCLADDVGVSVTCQHTIIQEILYLYLTSPYDNLRQSFSDLLSAWKGTPIADTAVRHILALISRIEEAQSLNSSNVSETTALSHADDTIALLSYYQSQLQHYQESITRLIKLHTITILNSLTDMTTNILYILEALSDPEWSIRQAAATALGLFPTSEPHTIDALLPLLSDPASWQVRQAAATSLGQLEATQPSVVDALLPLLSDSDSDVRQAATTALEQLLVTEPHIIDALLPLLSDSALSVRQAAATALGLLAAAEPYIIDALLPLLSDSAFSARQAAATALGLLAVAEPHVIDVLLPLLSDSAWQIRQATAIALGKSRTVEPHIADALFLLLSDSVSAVRQTAATALGQLGTTQPHIIETLLPLLSDNSADVPQAITILGQLVAVQPHAVDALLPLLADSSWQVRQNVVIILRQAEPRVVDALLPLLSDPAWQVRQSAAITLGQLGTTQPHIVDTLLPLLSDSVWQVRHAATTALGQLATTQPHVVDVLLPLLSDSVWQVRQSATTALGQLATTQPRVVDALLPLLSDSVWQIRQAVAITLGQSGTTQLHVVDALLPLLSDSDIDVQQAALTALGELATTQPHIIMILLQTISGTLPSFLFQNPLILTQTHFGLKGALISRMVLLLEKLGATQLPVVEMLLRLLLDSNSDVRQAAATALGQIGTTQPHVVDALLPLLSDSDSDVRQAATTALGRLTTTQPHVVDALLPLLSDSVSSIRQAAATTLGQIGTTQPHVVDALLPLLSDSVSSVRQAAATASGQIAAFQPHVIEALLRGQANTNFLARQTAAITLRRQAATQPQIIDVLFPLLSDNDSLVRTTATTALGLPRTAQPHIIDALLPLLSNSASDIRQAAATALGRLATPQPHIIDALLPLLSDSVSAVQQAAANALGLLGTAQPHIIDALLPLLSDSVSAVQQAAAIALGQLRTAQPHIVDALLPLLSDSSWQVRQSAAVALGLLGTIQPHAVDALLPLLSDNTSIVRMAAINALGHMEAAQPHVVDALLPLLSDNTSNVRIAAINILGKLGVAQPHAVDALLPLLSDNTSNVRIAAINTLGKLGVAQPHIVDALLPLLSDSVLSVRQAATTTLGLLVIVRPRVVDTLLPFLTDSSWQVRQAIATALGQSGVAQPHVVDALLPLLSDSDSSIRQSALTSLKNLNVSNLTIGSHIEETLLKFAPLTNKQLSADSFVDSLFDLLWKTVGDT